MVVAKIRRGKDFRGVLKYVLNQEEAEFLGGQVTYSNDINRIAKRFEAIASLRPTTQKPVRHFAIAFSPEDGEVDDITKLEVAERFLSLMGDQPSEDDDPEKLKAGKYGYYRNQYLVVAHNREDSSQNKKHDHDHIHIVANAITYGGERIPEVFDAFQAKRACRIIEKEFGLTQVTNESQRLNPPPQHQERIKREEQEFDQGKRENPPEPYIKGELQEIINNASSDRPELPEFFNRLIEEDVIPSAYITEKGRKRISYHYRGFNFRGSKLKEASFPKLIKNRGINYDPDRDEESMALARQGEINFDYIDQAEPETKDASELSPSPNPEAKDNSNEQRILSAIHQLLQSSKQDQIKFNYEDYGVTEKIARDGDDLTYSQNIQGQERVLFYATSPDGGNSWDVKTNQFSTAVVDELENKVPSLAKNLAEKAKDQKQLKPKQKQKQNQLEL